MDQKKKIKLGSIIRPHGIKGEAEVYLYSGDRSILKPGMVVLGLEQNFEIEKIFLKPPKFRIKFKNIDDRTYWENAKLPIDFYFYRHDFPPLPKGEYYLFDFVGLKLLGDEKKPMGEIINADLIQGQTYFQLRLLNGEEMELPFISSFFPGFNIPEGWMNFILPEVVE
jgi:16S rRNA processing protein RimM